MMMKMGLDARTRRAALVIAASLWAVGCTLDNGDGPSLTGPSEFAISVTATATPDRLPRDGSSQSIVTLNVRDGQNRPVAGQRLTLGLLTGSAGLSATEVVTDANGQATFMVTAPPASALAGATVQILATPVGNVSGGSLPRVIEISLTGAANTTAPTAVIGTPVPESPEVGQVTTFNASGSTDEGNQPCLDACTYVWSFGTERVRTGRIVTHAFQTPGVHSVTLTVTDAAGASASAQRNITVTSVQRPTVTGITVTPAAPAAGQATSFVAAFTVAPNHRITSFVWRWGDGNTTTTTDASTTHTFASTGTYVVTVTATDDVGQSASASTAVTVGGGAVASFTFSPTNPQPGDTVQFNGSASNAMGGATIVEWAWDFGDGTTETNDEATTSHVYNVDRTYVVRLTVTDSAGRTGTTTQNISVELPD